MTLAVLYYSEFSRETEPTGYVCAHVRVCVYGVSACWAESPGNSAASAGPLGVCSVVSGWFFFSLSP